MPPGAVARRPRVAAFCLLVEEDRVLLAHGDYGLRFWALPGGIVEEGEALEDAAARETLEETGLRVDVGRLIAVADVSELLLFVFPAVRTGGELRPEPGEIDDLRWFDLDALGPVRSTTYGLAEAMVERALGSRPPGRYALPPPETGHAVHILG